MAVIGDLKLSGLAVIHGAYCKACALFAPSDAGSQTLGMFVTKNFSVWTKQSSVFLKHEHLQDSMTRMVAFKESCSSTTQNVACMLIRLHMLCWKVRSTLSRSQG